MSLVPYREESLILDDPTSQSLIIVNPTSGTLSYFRQIDPDHLNDRSRPPATSIATFICPQCGTEIDATNCRTIPNHSDHRRSRSGSESISSSSRINLPGRYFQLLQKQHQHTNSISLSDTLDHKETSSSGFFIPPDLFIPGYFHKFFKTLSLLGNGARGSVYKVVHKIGDTDLGVFALKKIPIGNDMVWFQKCIREVKALSALTHKSANLITYNHVWLEMDDSCGLVRTADGTSEAGVGKIPCLFILQQFCEGGNLEDCILRDVFDKFPDLAPIDERKQRFRMKRKEKMEHLGSRRVGLNTRQIISILRDISRGLHELHDIGLIHRDLKPSNCLLLQKFNKEASL